MAHLPEFKSVEEEVEFWETHDSAPYWEKMEEVKFNVELHQNAFHPKLIFLTRRPDGCPRCQADLEDVFIEYVTQNEGHLLAIRNVPVLRCQDKGHEFLLAETLEKIERLLELEKLQKLKPAESLNVPVYELRKPAE